MVGGKQDGRRVPVIRATRLRRAGWLLLLVGSSLGLAAGSSQAAGTAQGSATRAQVTQTMTFSIASSADDGSCEKGDAGYPPAAGTSVVCSTVATSLATRRSACCGGAYKPVTVSLLRFDTSALPDDAQISSATLLLYVKSVQDANGRSVAAEWYPASNWPIDAGDWTVTDSGSAHSGTPLGSLATNQADSFALQNLSSISATGQTALRLHITGAATGPSGENLLQLAASDGGANAPQLQVTYSVPISSFTANVFVDAVAGSSPARCASPCTYDPTRAYGSFAAACAATQAGDKVGVRGGVYGVQTITRANCNPSSPITFEAVSGDTPILAGLTVGQNDGGSQPGNLTFRGLTITGSSSTTAVFVYWGNTSPSSSAHDLVFDNDRIAVGQPTRGPAIDAIGVQRLTIRNSTIGPACCGLNSSGSPNGSTVGIRLGVAGPNYPRSTNVVIDNNLIQGITRSCSYWLNGYGACPQSSCTDSTACHADGIQIWGADTVSITRNRIYNDEVQGIFVDTTALNSNFDIVNNMISTVNGSAAIAVNMGGGNSAGGTWNIKFNSTPNVVIVGPFAGAQAGTVVNLVGNTGYFLLPDTTGNAASCSSNPSTVTIHYWYNQWRNPFDVGGTNTSSCSVFDSNNASQSFVNTSRAPNAGVDLHSREPWAGKDFVPTSVSGGCPATDIDGTVRPVGSACDAGADEIGSGPTAIRVSTMRVLRTGSSVALRWRTADETGVLGFAVYRSTASQRTRLTRTLIVAAGRATGRAYSFRDRKPPLSRQPRYWLEEVRLDGSRNWYGPLRPT